MNNNIKYWKYNMHIENITQSIQFISKAITCLKSKRVNNKAIINNTSNRLSCTTQILFIAVS